MTRRSSSAITRAGTRVSGGLISAACLPKVNGIQVGGQFQALGSVQYLVPVTADETFSLVVAFSDFGTVESDVGFNSFPSDRRRR